MKNIFILSFLFLFFSCGLHTEKKSFINKNLLSVKLSNKSFTDNIFFTENNDLIFIPVEISGKTYNFMFDTGALTTISESLNNELKLDKIKSKFNFGISDGIGEDREKSLYKLEKLKIGTQTFTNIGVIVQDLSNLRNRCVKIDGILGANILRSCYWKIDYINKKISFSDEKSFLEINNPNIRISFKENDSGSPIINMVFGEYSFNALWDTGFNSGIQIPDSLFFKSYKQKITPKIHGTSLSIATIFQKGINKINRYNIVADSLYLDDFLLKEQLLTVGPLKSPLIGNKFIKQADEVFLDWNTHQIALKNKPNLINQETFGFLPFKLQDSVVIVSIWDDSQAKKNGLNVGDTILAINNQNVNKINKETWCDYFNEIQSQNEMKIEVKSNNSKKSYTFKKYNFFN